MKNATYEDIKRVLSEYFNGLDSKPSIEELNDRLYIEIQNDEELLTIARHGIDRKLQDGIFSAISTALMRVINQALTYEDENNPLVFCRNYSDIVKALEEIHGRDILDIIRPTYDYYKKAGVES